MLPGPHVNAALAARGAVGPRPFPPPAPLPVYCAARESWGHSPVLHPVLPAVLHPLILAVLDRHRARDRARATLRPGPPPVTRRC